MTELNGPSSFNSISKTQQKKQAKAKAKTKAQPKVYVPQTQVVYSSRRSQADVLADIADVKISTADYAYHKSHGFTNAVTQSLASNHDLVKLLYEAETAMPKFASTSEVFSLKADVVVSTDKYIDPDAMTELVKGHRVVLIKAPTGAGKSHFIRHYASQTANFVAVASLNVMSTKSYATDSDFSHVYSKSGGDINAKHVACTLHQLPKVFRAHEGQTATIVLDEIVTMLADIGNADGGLLNSFCIDNLAGLLEYNADTVIAMDAFADNRTVARLQQMTGTKPFVIEVKQTNPTVPYDVLRATVATATDIAITTAKQLGKASLNLISKAQVAKAEAAGKRAGLKVLAVMNDESDFDKTLDAVHAGGWDLLVYTSKLGAGFDIQVPVVLAISCIDLGFANVRHGLQAVGRLRNAQNRLLVYTNIPEEPTERRVTLSRSLATMCYLDNWATSLDVVGDRLFSLVKAGESVLYVERGIEDCRGDNLDATIDEFQYVADEYKRFGINAFKSEAKRAMHDWLDMTVLAMLAMANWFHLGEITGIDLAKSDSTRLARNYSNTTVYTAKDIATKLDISTDEAFALVDQALDLAEQSPNAFPKYYAKRRAALNQMAATGKMTEADHEMFGTKQINRALATVGQQSVRCGKTSLGKRKVVLSDAYKAYKFALDNTRLVQILLQPEHSKAEAEYLETVAHMADTLAYAKANWPVALNAEIRDLLND